MNRLVLQAIYLIIHDLAVGFKKSGVALNRGMIIWATVNDMAPSEET